MTECFSLDSKIINDHDRWAQSSPVGWWRPGWGRKLGSWRWWSRADKTRQPLLCQSTELQIRCLVPLIIRKKCSILSIYVYNITWDKYKVYGGYRRIFLKSWKLHTYSFLHILFQRMFPCVLISAKSLHVEVGMFLLDFLDAALLQSLINSWWMFVKIFLQNEPLWRNSFTKWKLIQKSC